MTRFTTTRLRKIIESLDKDTYEQSLQWYINAHSFCKGVATRFNLPVETVVKVLAVLSPSVTWAVNQRDTITIIEKFQANVELDSFTVSTYGNNKTLAWNILSGTEDLVKKPTNRKTFAFYNNILNPYCSKHVTIDRWAIKAVTSKTDLYDKPIRGKLYDTCVSVHKRLAEELGILPNQVQALAWVAIRGSVN